jgi:hypothetical protein
VLADAQRFAVTLPRPAADIQHWFAARAAALDEVTTPVLVHFDLWDSNILVESNSAGRRIGALIDAERGSSASLGLPRVPVPDHVGGGSTPPLQPAAAELARREGIPAAGSDL